AGTYIMGLLIQAIHLLAPNLYNQLHLADSNTSDMLKRYGAVVIAVGVTLYFLRQNLLGIHESSDKALKIMYATTVMAVIMLVWCGITLAFRGPVNSVPPYPNLDPKVEFATVTEPDPQHPGEEIERWQTDAQGRL